MRLTRLVLLLSLVALVVVPAAWAIRFTDDSYDMPIGATGQSYSKQFNGAGGCGPALPYQYSLLNSELPTGLSLSKSGLISGVPTQGGDWSFWVELSDENPPSASWCRPSTAQREFTIKILQGLAILQSSVPSPAYVGQPYNAQLSTDKGGSTWTVQSGTLPPGVGLAGNGLLSGTPTAAGDFSFVAKATNGSTTATRTYSVKVLERLKVTKPVTVRAAEVGKTFALDVRATGGTGVHTWSLAGGALPGGLILDSATGLISGKPTVAGSFPVKLSVADGFGQSDTVDVTIGVAAKLSIVKRPLRALKVGVPYKARLIARGGVTPLRWKILGGLPGFLPSGIKLDVKTGQLSGTPTKSGVWRLRIQVKDKLGAVSSVPVLLKVNA